MEKEKQQADNNPASGYEEHDHEPRPEEEKRKADEHPVNESDQTPSNQDKEDTIGIP